MKKSEDCYVQGVATAVPDSVLTADACAARMRRACRDPRLARLLPRLIRLAGIEKRHLAALELQTEGDGRGSLYDVDSERVAGMGRRTGLFDPAARLLVGRVLEQFSPAALRDVDTLVTVNCTQAASPGLELPVFACAPLRAEIDRWNLGFMGCSAALAALRLLRRCAAAGEALVVACELSSLHFQFTDRLDQLTANVLFADGAAAVRVSPRPSAIRIVDCRSVTLPAGAAQMQWLADDHGLRMVLDPELPTTLAAHLPEVVDAFLDANGRSRAEVPFWAIHPGGPQILDAAEAALGLPADALRFSRDVLRQYGNMSSPTVLFILREIFELRRDGWCLAIAFGPGLTIELALFEMRRG